MKINLKIDDGLDEDVVDFRIRKLTDKIQKAIDYLNTEEPKVIIGYKKDEIVLIKPDEILVIFTEGKRIYARLVNGEKYTVKERLYELEKDLESAGFIRIANSSISQRENDTQIKDGT